MPPTPKYFSLRDPSLLRGEAYINGEWQNSDSNATLNIVNPANNERIHTVACCGTNETRRAILAAEQARKPWQKKTAQERARMLRRIYELMIEHQEDLAQILTLEQGKPLAEARAEIAYSASYFEWFSEECKRLYGDTIPSTDDNKRIIVTKQGIGVVACITPWNFPSAMLGRKIAPALAAGCTVVCKPASATPLSANAIAALAERAGVPAGVINMVCGLTQEIGDELSQHPLVRKLTFTGSTHVGKKLMKQCATTIKRTSMELGGNAPFIVFDDAEMDEAIAGAMASKFRNTGQTCICSNRILVQDSIYDLFIKKLTAAVAQLRIGNGFTPQNTIGPLIDKASADSVCGMIDEAVNAGATIYCGGKRVDGLGNFVEPTILGNVNHNMRVSKEEIFGPVAAVSKFSDEQEAITMANDTEVGLAAYFYTRDIGRIWRISEALDYGIVGVNEGIVSTEVAPFGGMKQSGNGREGSKYGLDDYIEIKYVCMGGINK